MQNDTVNCVDLWGLDIQKIPLYSSTNGFLGVVRFSAGVAIDSNSNVAIYTKIEIGLGVGITAIDNKVLNSLGISALNDVETLYNDLFLISQTYNLIDNLPEDTGKGNLNDLPIKDYFLGTIPVGQKKESTSKTDKCERGNY